MGFDYTKTNKRWRQLREQVLREAGYRCQYARRFGRREEATRVHHIWPVEEYPQYAYCRWNLIALSHESHMMMHVPGTGELSKTGEALRRKTKPAPPGRGPKPVCTNSGQGDSLHTQEKFSEGENFSGGWPGEDVNSQ